MSTGNGAGLGAPKAEPTFSCRFLYCLSEIITYVGTKRSNVVHLHSCLLPARAFRTEHMGVDGWPLQRFHDLLLPRSGNWHGGPLLFGIRTARAQPTLVGFLGTFTRMFCFSPVPHRSIEAGMEARCPLALKGNRMYCCRILHLICFSP